MFLYLAGGRTLELFHRAPDGLMRVIGVVFHNHRADEHDVRFERAMDVVRITGGTVPFPARHVYCLGRNYAAHPREMGFDPDRAPPFFFCKPNDDGSVVLVVAGAMAMIATA